MEEFVVKINDKDYCFRIKKMNGVKALSFRRFITKMEDSIELNEQVYYSILENAEVQVGYEWLTCKQGNDFIPVGLIDNVEAILNIVNKFMEYLKSFF